MPLRPACLKEGHPCPPSSPLPPLSLLIRLSFNLPLLSSLLLAPSSSIPPSTQAGLRVDVQNVSFRLGPHCQLRAILSVVVCPGSFFLLSRSSCGQRRPYKATFLLIHFCQFQHCHSNHFSGEWRGRVSNVPCSKDCAFWSKFGFVTCQQQANCSLLAAYRYFSFFSLLQLTMFSEESKTHRKWQSRNSSCDPK